MNSDYFFLIGRKLFRLATRIFFSRIDITGVEPIEKGAVLIVPNHPNMLIDSLLILLAYERPLWFVAKSTMFSNTISRFLLKAAHLVPIYRQKDGSDTSLNQDIFNKIVEKLHRDEAVNIFPEGTCTLERRLLKIKTGAARIAFQAEAEKNFLLGLKIQPVGITYADPVSFKSSVTVHIGEPIEVAKYRESYNLDPANAVRELTKEIEECLREITVEVPNESERIISEKIARLYEAAESDRNKLATVVKNVCAVAPNFPDFAREIERRIDTVLAFDERVDKRISPKFIMLFPLLLLGMTLNYVPYRLVGSLSKAKSSEDLELASNKFLYGLVIFPAWALLIGLVSSMFFRSCAFGFLMTLLTLGLGVLVSKYFAECRLHILTLLFSEEAEAVRIIKKGIIADLERLRVE